MSTFLLQPCDYFMCVGGKSQWGLIECTEFAKRMVRAPNGTMIQTKNGMVADSIGQFHHSLMNKLTHALCIERARRPGSRYLGSTIGCQQTVNGTCGSREFNVSVCLHTKPGYLNASLLDPSKTHLMRWPDDSGAGSLVDCVWLCSDYWYQILPPLWSGRCALIYLTPSIMVMSSLVHTTHHYPQYIPPSAVSLE